MKDLKDIKDIKDKVDKMKDSPIKSNIMKDIKEKSKDKTVRK